MQPPRSSIATLMFVVAAVAIDIAVARLALSLNYRLLLGIVLIGITLEVGLCRLIRSRGEGRTYWAGFVAFGSAAMMTVIWAFLFRDSLLTAWACYVEYTFMLIGFVVPWVLRSEVIGTPLVATIMFLPQFLIAVIGGLLSRAITRRWGLTRVGGTRPIPQADDAQLPPTSLLAIARP